MRSKRLLAMLLALCMVLSVFSPAAMAVEAGNDTIASVVPEAEDKENNTASRKENDLMISPEKIERHELLNLRDHPLYNTEVNTKYTKGYWEITPAVKPEVSLTPDAPACLEELKEAAKFYNAEEIVKAFVVMEDAPLAESHNSISLASTSAKKQLIEKQDSVINAIENKVLNGQVLEVRYQFTYLTNAFSIETAFANLAEIAVLPGVKDVVIMSTWDAVPTETADPLTAAANPLTGVDTVWADLGYTGEGMKIAIVDTGLDLDHPSFAAAPAGASMDVDDIAAVLEDLNIYKRNYGKLSAEDLYRSEKVPFAYNYCDDNLKADHNSDQQGDHGTHVAGIAAANKTEGTSVVGMAPDAQIIVMKVFGANGGAYTDDFVAAIEDAMTLGCDVVNLSLGSPAGFSDSGYETVDGLLVDEVFANLKTQNIIATISAGNETNSSYGNMWGTDMNRTQNPENGVVGSPSSYINSFSIASANNSVIMTNYMQMADGTKFFYQPCIEYLYGYVYGFVEMFGGETLEYAIVPGLGAPEDFFDAEGNSIVEGKIAIIKRGELSFAEKIQNAAMAGAVAAIIWNTNDTEDIFTFGMTTELEPGVYTDIVSAIITLSDGQKLADAETKTLLIAENLAERPVQGGQMSSFSSWGTTSDLRLVPDITGIGGNVYSTLDRGQYGVMSGTSMSAPQVAGVSALVMQYLYEKFPNAADGEIREMALALMMSTANPVIANESGLEASPRQQGAGLVNAAEAVLTNAYLTVDGGRPKAELGDSVTGEFSFDFEIHNFGNEAATYTLNASLLTEQVEVAWLSETDFVAFMAGFETALEGSVTFSQNQVTVAPGETVTVSVSIALSEEQKAFLDYVWANGAYVEGYVYLTNADEEGVDLNLPFLGFYGDWTDAPVFDTAYWYDNSFFDHMPVDGLPEGDQYYHAFWTDLAGTDWVLGMNPYSGEVLDENGQIIYDPANNALSPNGDGVLDGITEIYLSLLRNAAEMTFTYTVDGEVVYQEITYNNPKTMFMSSYGRVVPWVGSWYLDSLYYTGMAYDFTDAAGNPLPSGTEVLLTIDAKIDYADGGNNVMQIPMYVDTTAPELLEVYEIPQDGSNYLVLDVKDNHNIASVVILNKAGTKVLAQQFDIHGEALSDGSDRFYFDVTGLGTELTVVVCDYACNETYCSIEYTADPEGNMPVMDTDLLYAYRVSDPLIDYNMGYDYQFGWVSMNKPENDISGLDAAIIYPETNDYMEMYALTAAEFAGGKIFAIDAGNNFLVMTPGLWDRQIIVNLGEDMSALDMAFDDTTDTMYVIIKSGYDAVLYSIDLLTGELTEVNNYGYYYYAPFALTVADDGTIYAIKNSASGLYTLDKENGFAMVAVTDADGAELVITDSYGEAVKPNYAQSMTFVNGKIYWAYIHDSWRGTVAEMITIDVANGFAVTNNPYYTVYPELNYEDYSYTELVGLLTLDPTDYEIPAAESLSGLLMAEDHVILKVGETTSVSVSPIPWNYELGELNWSSNDETVATVDAAGNITAVGAGTTVITAFTDDNIAAEVVVSVIDPHGQFYAYNYFNGTGVFGDFVSVDLADMTMSSLGYSPVDFIAGDYNGHDGCFYGYDEQGQMYKLDMATGDLTKIGGPTGIIPTDMAYDYSTGLLYAAYINDGLATLAYADMNTGKIIDAGVDYTSTMMLLAIDLEGNIYTMTAEGMVAKIGLEESMDWMTGEPMNIVVYEEILMDGLGYLQYNQTMCYDHNNNVLLWCHPEASEIFWVDCISEYPYVMSLGDPSESGLLQWMGMFTIPAEIPELAPVAVESVSADDMFMVVGQEKMPNINILPLNANNYTASMVSSDESVVAIEDGMLVALSEGTATITLTVDDAVSGQPTVVEFVVNTVAPADNVYAHILTDLASMSGYLWVELPVLNPAEPVYANDTFSALGSSFVIYAEEYYDGKLYVYGYDDSDWTNNFQFMVLDAETFQLLEMYDMGAGFPFVYDMTYDYNTSTMYCVAGASSEASNLYAVNMKNGKLTLLLETEQFFMTLAAGPDGLYAVAHSETIQDEWDPWAPATVLNANLYLINPSTMEVEIVGDTGLVCNSLGSMSYDYDTDKLYWAVLNQNDYTGGLAIMDPATGTANIVDTIGAAGAQVTGLYIVCDEFPAENPQLHELFVTEKALTYVGHSVAIDVATLAMNLDAEITFVSSDESVATVDENGVVTAIAKGQADITVTASFGGVVKTAVCEVAVLNADAGFLTYNTTTGGWALVNRADPSLVTPLTEDEDAPAVSALTSVGTAIYGYDVEGNFFTLDPATYEREVISALDHDALVQEFMDFHGLEDDLANYAVDVRDMAYDAANERVLVLANIYDVEYGTMVGGDNIYELNLETGELTHVYMILNNFNVMAMTVGADGMVYYYNAFDDNYTALDLVNMTETNIVSLQSISKYGSVDHVHELFYDELSGNVYHLFTGNGNAYRLLALNTVTGSVEEVGTIGEIVYEDEWTYFGDSFSGLVFVDGVEFESTVFINPFDDVNENNYFYDAVEWAYMNGITSGRTETHFGTGEEVTRAQFVTFLWAAAGRPEPTITENPFTDVKESNWFYKAVLWAYEEGITSGVTATTFGPGNTCTRNQVVTFLWVYAGRPEPVTTENPFSDVEAGKYYYKAVLWALENGITAGRTPTVFGTHESCKREQAVTFLYKALAE